MTGLSSEPSSPIVIFCSKIRRQQDHWVAQFLSDIESLYLTTEYNTEEDTNIWGVAFMLLLVVHVSSGSLLLRKCVCFLATSLLIGAHGNFIHSDRTMDGQQRLARHRVCLIVRSSSGRYRGSIRNILHPWGEVTTDPNKSQQYVSPDITTAHSERSLASPHHTTLPLNTGV